MLAGLISTSLHPYILLLTSYFPYRGVGGVDDVLFSRFCIAVLFVYLLFFAAVSTSEGLFDMGGGRVV